MNARSGDGLSRRQFLFALGAGVVAGMQFDRFGGAEPVTGFENTFGTVETLGSPSDLLGFIEEPLALDEVGSGTQPAPTPTSITDALVDQEAATAPPAATAIEDPFVVTDDGLSPEDVEALKSIQGDTPALATLMPQHFAGASLAGWKTVLGDSRHTAEGLETVNDDDVATAHLSDRSVLAANRHGRGVMAHNTTYLRHADDIALQMLHHAQVEIRTPVTPAQVSGLPNGQTVEIALFVWDGKGSRRDIGLGLQWMINPWSENFGALRTWMTNEDGSSNWSPDPVAWRDPTDEWQLVDMTLDPISEIAAVSIGGQELEAQCTRTKKPDSWAYRTAASLAVELVSIWPGDRVTAPTTRLEARNYEWDWTVPV